ncbi:MAG: molecular chaperone DnaJ [Acutalibacteraceae bacterium]|nr:molecular chaperone DnaJ [Acutalibacteraceae bacterium]
MSEKRDYYEVLGVDKSVNDDDLKKAYRKAAKKYHPDLHPGDAEAEKSFKEVNEAYEILSDKEKRARYDQFGHAGVDPNFGAGQGGNPFGGGFGGGFGDFGDLGDILGSMFGGGFGGGRRRDPNAPRRGADTATNIVISFMEAAKGCKKDINVTRTESCSECSGTGAEKGTQVKTCPTCHGSGQVMSGQRTPFGVIQTQTACENCRGTGKIIDKPCRSCAGKGRVRKTTAKSIDIPAGIDDGQTITLRGGGDMGANGGPAGDLHITVSVRPHPIFEREGFDIFCEIPITYSQACLGAEITVPTLDGKAKFTIHEGTQPGDEFKLRGKGIKRLNYSGNGDEYVKVVVEVPKDLNKEQRKKLEEFENSLEEKNYKKRKSFFDKVKDLFD